MLTPSGGGAQRHRDAKKGPAVQEYNDDGTLKDMKGAVKHRERYRKKGAVRDAKYGKGPETRKKLKRQSSRRSKSGR